MTQALFDSAVKAGADPGVLARCAACATARHHYRQGEDRCACCGAARRPRKVPA